MSTANFPGDPEDNTDNTPFEALQSSTLSKAGWAYLLGDASLFAAGAMKGQWKEASTGALWGIAGLFPAFYGNPKAEKQLELLSNHLGDYLRKQGITIPKEPDTQLLMKPQGVWDHMESFFYAYPSQMLNAVYAIGSTTLIASGIQKGNRGDTAAGALVAAGALAGLLVPEKKIDPENPPKTAFSKAVAWLQEKPLRISGAFYWANNIGLMAGALEDKRKNPANKGYIFKYLTVASYVFGNAMLAMSSKGHGTATGTENHAAMNKLAVSAAHVIAAQPPQVQEALINQIAGFLASDPHAHHLKAEEISNLLHQKMKEIVKSPLQPGWQGRIGDMTGAQPAPSL
jgi:hypothetical protein